MHMYDNNNRVYTQFFERCSISGVYISQYNINHKQYREYELSSMIRAAGYNISNTSK